LRQHEAHVQVRARGVVAQVEFESKKYAILKAVYHILVSSAESNALSTRVSNGFNVQRRTVEDPLVV